MKKLQVPVLAVVFLLGVVCFAQATVTTIPDSALNPTTQLYTDMIGGGIGSVVVMTGGGNAPGIGDPTGRNDDGYSGPINLGFTYNFFGTDYTQFFANNNGNISFNGGISAYTPTGPTGASQPIISPFFADVDTRNPASGVMYLRTDIPNEIIVTWQGVGYFDERATNAAGAPQLDTLQLVLRGPGYTIPAGQGPIGFFWTTMQWETGEASGGTNGFGGTPAAVGFGDGLGNAEVLEGSIANGIAAIVNDEYVWFDQNLQPIGVPEPVTMLLLGFGLVGLAGVRRFKK